MKTIKCPHCDKIMFDMQNIKEIKKCPFCKREIFENPFKDLFKNVTDNPFNFDK